jgi:hypothetical protein
VTVQDIDIDFVILWVDGSDPPVAAEHAAALAAESAERVVPDSPNRHRDNGELLFLLRSIRAHLPWFRRIYLVTNGQRPRYVDLTSDRTRLVSHEQIFPADITTPSFNTFAIDSCVHEIEGLSEYFVRFSDDFFIGRDIPKKEFLGIDNLGLNLVAENVFSHPPGYYYYDGLQANAVRFWQEFGYLPMYNFAHMPQLRRRSTMRELVVKWPGWFEETRRRRFRSKLDAVSLFLYPYFSLFHHRKEDLDSLAQERDAPSIMRVGSQKGRGGFYAPQVNVGANNDWRAILNRVVTDPPRFLNVNDDMLLRPNPADRTFVGEKLCRLYPKPSPWEINPASWPGYAQEAAKAFQAAS